MFFGLLVGCLHDRDAKEVPMKKVWTVEELREMPLGTRFLIERPRTSIIGTIRQKNGVKYMEFSGG
jgi:hypothetical protein